MDAITQAIFLMLIGMVTVFAVLTLVTLVGRFTIWWTNRNAFAPRETSAFGKSTAPTSQEHDREIAAVIVAAVDQVTEGRGRVVKIDKIN